MSLPVYPLISAVGVSVSVVLALRNRLIRNIGRSVFLKKPVKNVSSVQKDLEKIEQVLSGLLHIHEIGTSASGVKSRKEICDAVLENACRLMNSNCGSIMVFEEGPSELRIVSARGISIELVEQTRLKPGEGIAGRVFQTGESIFTPVPSKNPMYIDYCSSPDQQTPFIAIPLKVNKRCLGVMNIHSSASAEPFSEYNLKLLSILSEKAAVSLENIKLHDTLHSFYLEMVETLARVIDAKDSYTYDHAGRARRKARRIAEALNLSETEILQIEYAALLHDIGKIGIKENILLKPGKLTNEEFEEIKKHPSIGYQILAPVDFLSGVSQMVLYHQEWFNGSGYPSGLNAADIPLGSRIVAAIDAWDAMVSDRPYRKALPRSMALEELKKGAGSQFDPQIIEVFKEIENTEWKSETEK